MAKMRQDPAFRERANQARRGYPERDRQYRQSLKADFFRFRASLHRSHWKEAVTASDLRELWDKQAGRCALTGRKLTEEAELDHIVPVSRGGTHKLPNLQWLCREANRAKRELTDEEFVAFASEVVAWNAGRFPVGSDDVEDVTASMRAFDGHVPQWIIGRLVLADARRQPERTDAKAGAA